MYTSSRSHANPPLGFQEALVRQVNDLQELLGGDWAWVSIISSYRASSFLSPELLDWSRQRRWQTSRRIQSRILQEVRTFLYIRHNVSRPRRAVSTITGSRSVLNASSRSAISLRAWDTFWLSYVTFSGARKRLLTRTTRPETHPSRSPGSPAPDPCAFAPQRASR